MQMVTVVANAECSSRQHNHDCEGIFQVHKDFLCKVSPYFDSLFNGNFSESRELKTKVDFCTQVFRYFLEWLYSGRLVGSTSNEDGDADLRSWDLMKLHFFADTYIVPDLTRATFLAFYLRTNPGNSDYFRSITIGITKESIKYLDENSPWIRYLVDYYAYRVFDMAEEDIAADSSLIGLSSRAGELPSEFLAQVLQVKSRRGTMKERNANFESPPFKRPGCPYLDEPFVPDDVSSSSPSQEESRTELSMPHVLV